MSQLNTLQDLFIDQISDLLSAENQLVGALPKVVQAAQDRDLAEAIEGHLAETRMQVDRLKKIFQGMGIQPQATTCQAMKGLIQETEETLELGGRPQVINAAIIACAQRVEHYEIAAYGCAREYADLLDLDDAKELLKETIKEEAGANEKLNKLSKRINDEAREVSEPVSTNR
jgi:ferritin-like metal-binding protein YciE